MSGRSERKETINRAILTTTHTATERGCTRACVCAYNRGASGQFTGSSGIFDTVGMRMLSNWSGFHHGNLYI